MMKMNKKIGILALLAVIAVVIAVVLISRHVGLLISRIEETPGEEVMPEEIGPPISDVIGNDIPDVPRYPGSVRTSYTSFSDEKTRTATVGYITSASVDEILRFYKRELPVNNWIDIMEMQIENNFTLAGHKEGASMQAYINPDEHYPDHASILIWIERYQE